MRKSSFATIVLAVSMALVACGDTSSASDDEVPVSSAIPESSSSAEDPYYEGIHNQGNPACHDSVAIDSSVLLPFCSCDESLLSDGMYIRRYKTLTTLFEPNKDCDLSVYYHCEGGRWHLVDKEDIPADSTIYSAPLELVFYNTNFFELKKCTAEREGTVDNVFDGGYYRYYRCEQSSWKEIDPPKSEQLVCDTASVTVGALCKTTIRVSTGHMVEDRIVWYIYAGNGVWESYEIPHLSVNCSGENDGKKGLKTYGNETGSYTEYYTCLNGELLRLSELEYYCSEESDTCSYELNGKTQYSLRKDSSWVKCDYDSTVGYCCTDDDFYREAGEKYYYCGKGTWLQPELVPHQYTDPRKDSLTDAEFDVLDLPKDASVGDVAGGLMEDCYHAPLFPKDGVYWDVDDEVSEYCVPRKYYTYSIDGTWEELSLPDYRPCMPEIEGEEYWYRRGSADYNFYEIFKCEGYEWESVGYNFSRSKKK